MEQAEAQKKLTSTMVNVHSDILIDVWMENRSDFNQILADQHVDKWRPHMKSINTTIDDGQEWEGRVVKKFVGGNRATEPLVAFCYLEVRPVA